MLQVGFNSTYSQLLWTNASDVDFSNPVQGRTDSTRGNTTPTLNVNFTIPVANANDQCYLFIPNLGSYVFIHDSNFLKCNSQWTDSFRLVFSARRPN